MPVASVATFTAKAAVARAKLEPLIRSMAAEWDARHPDTQGGSAATFFCALGQAIGRVYAEKLPDGLMPSIALDMLLHEIQRGMLEVIGAPAGSTQRQ